MSSKSLKTDGITLLGVTSNPINPNDGDVIYRSDLGKFLVRENSTWNQLAGATGIQGSTGPSGGGGGGGGGGGTVKTFLFDGSIFPMTNFAQTCVVTSNYVLATIALTANISGIAGTTVVQVNIGGGPSGSLTTTASLSANGSLNSSITATSISLQSGDKIWVDVNSIASDQLEDLCVELILQ